MITLLVIQPSFYLNPDIFNALNHLPVLNIAKCFHVFLTLYLLKITFLHPPCLVQLHSSLETQFVFNKSSYFFDGASLCATFFKTTLLFPFSGLSLTFHSSYSHMCDKKVDSQRDPCCNPWIRICYLT